MPTNTAQTWHICVENWQKSASPPVVSGR